MTADVTLEKFGYKFGQSGAHSARSIMLVELRTLFVATPTDALQDQYKTDICDYNLLDKPTVKSRTLTYRHLIDLYGMSPDVPLFRVFRRLCISQHNFIKLTYIDTKNMIADLFTKAPTVSKLSQNIKKLLNMSA